LFEIVAHRGVAEHAPENTLPAFLRAKELGADAVELDVRLTADKVPVVFHFFYLDGLTSLTGTIFQYTWNELHQAKLFQNGIPAAGISIPTLEEVLDGIGNQIGLEIEIKGPEPSSAEIVANVLDNYPHIRDNLEITSYEPLLLERFRRLIPGVPTDLLVPLSEPWMKSDVLAYTALQRSRLAGARAVHLHASQLAGETIQAIRAGGCEVHAWGVNERRSLELANELQISRLCTDNLRQAITFREALRNDNYN